MSVCVSERLYGFRTDGDDNVIGHIGANRDKVAAHDCDVVVVDSKDKSSINGSIDQSEQILFPL